MTTFTSLHLGHSKLSSWPAPDKACPAIFELSREIRYFLRGLGAGLGTGAAHPGPPQGHQGPKDRRQGDKIYAQRTHSPFRVRLRAHRVA
jgi:hypothetical protein